MSKAENIRMQLFF